MLCGTCYTFGSGQKQSRMWSGQNAEWGRCDKLGRCIDSHCAITYRFFPELCVFFHTVPIRGGTISDVNSGHFIRRVKMLLLFVTERYNIPVTLSVLVLTWIGKRPGSIHVADVRSDAHCQDAVHQGDQAAVPLVTPTPIHAAQDEVERDPKQQAQERDNQHHCHLPFCRQGERKLP